MIDVTQNEDGKLSISWDENDPKESILNTYTQDDFKALIQNYLDKTQAEQDYAVMSKNTTIFRDKSKSKGNITEASEEDFTTTSGTTRQTRKSKSSVSIKPPTRSRDLSLFPHKASYRIEIKSEKRVAWFQCEEHAIKFLHRHHPKPFTHFKYYVFPQD